MFNLPATFVSTFLASQFTTLPYPNYDFTGQTIIITGANTGLGLEAARHIARLGAARLILGCRSIEKGRDAVDDIEASVIASLKKNNKDTKDNEGIICQIEVWELDLSSYTCVKQFCKRVEGLERLDAVIENAGVAIPEHELVEGCERTIVVNVYSTFLLALLVLPKLRESVSKFGILPRLVIVSSEAHEQARFKEQDAESIFTALNDGTNQSDKYNVSKLLEILIVRALAPLLTASPKSNIILNTLTPGFCHSDLMRHAQFPLNALGWVGKRLIGRSAEEGSRTLVHAASVEGAEGTHGAYLANCRRGKVSKWVESEKGRETQNRVWEEMVDILGAIEYGLGNNI